MAAHALHREIEFVGRSHELARAESYLAHLQIGVDMLTDHRLDIVRVERLLGQHQRRSARSALLAGLEQSQNRTLEIGIGLQTLQHAVQHGRMAVVTAGVHNAGVARRPLHARKLRDRQRIDIGAKHHATFIVSAPPLDAGQQPRGGYRSKFDARLRQTLGNESRRRMLLEREFGPAMQFAAKILYIHDL